MKLRIDELERLDVDPTGKQAGDAVLDHQCVEIGDGEGVDFTAVKKTPRVIELGRIELHFTKLDAFEEIEPDGSDPARTAQLFAGN